MILLSFLIAITPPSGFHTVQGQLTPIIPPYVPPDTNSFIFDGNGLPEGEGWSHSGYSNETTSDLSAGEIYAKGGNYLYFQAETFKDQVNQYCIDTTVRDSFFASIRVKILSETSNSYDAGFGFGVIGNCTQPVSIAPDRWYNLIIDPNQIIFGDYSASYPVDSSLFHTYLITIKNGVESVYLDVNYSEVVANNIQPVLTRPQGTSESDNFPGIISFGDSSNDTGRLGTYNQIANSKYQIDYITFGTINNN